MASFCERMGQLTLLKAGIKAAGRATRHATYARAVLGLGFAEAEAVPTSLRVQAPTLIACFSLLVSVVNILSLRATLRYARSPLYSGLLFSIRR